MLSDTIYATASASGASERAVLRFSGPLAFAAAESALSLPLDRVRAQARVQLCIGAFRVDALALTMPSPNSYTGEDCVELHVPGSPALLSEIAAIARAACGDALRAARPGEFTARACQNGRMDLAQAEGVLMLIHGEQEEHARCGAAWIAGALSAAVAAIRSRTQDALALLEAGLDFEEGDTGAVADAAWRSLLRDAEAEATQLADAMPRATLGGEVLLLGKSNAGKSSLCNALALRDAVLVDSAPGTTRDILRVELGNGAAIWDAPGDLESAQSLDQDALALRDRLATRASFVALVVDPRDVPARLSIDLPCMVVVWTKRDLCEPGPQQRELLRLALPNAVDVPEFSVSARDGRGIDALRAFLAQRSKANVVDPGEPLRAAVRRARDALARAAAAEQPELASHDAQEALSCLDQVDGSHCVEDLLDRIYGRFCLGK